MAVLEVSRTNEHTKEHQNMDRDDRDEKDGSKVRTHPVVFSQNGDYVPSARSALSAGAWEVPTPCYHRPSSRRSL
jgi:hypothetical protein